LLYLHHNLSQTLLAELSLLDRFPIYLDAITKFETYRIS
jgi:hypothetical protein